MFHRPGGCGEIYTSLFYHDRRRRQHRLDVRFSYNNQNPCCVSVPRWLEQGRLWNSLFDSIRCTRHVTIFIRYFHVNVCDASDKLREFGDYLSDVMLYVRDGWPRNGTDNETHGTGFVLIPARDMVLVWMHVHDYADDIAVYGSKPLYTNRRDDGFVTVHRHWIN